MKQRINKVLSFFLSFVLCTSLVPTTAFAATPEVITGTNVFMNNKGEITDTFIFREDCFMRSSYLGCAHLYELSAQAALASGHYVKDSDYSQGAKNITAMLETMGFSSIAANTYYSEKPIDDSMGVAVGQRTIVDDGVSYTLLAIFPRSGGYELEWISNAKLDNGDIHGGFKAGRDEILRFVKQYVENNNVTGRLKLWIAGHSRGAAVSNLVGGFFADGGVEYLGSDLSLSTKDIYCYCLATPNAIKDGISKAEELSVAANRESYPQDTKADAWTASDASGTVSVSATRFNGIRTFVSDADVVPQVPLSAWGYTRYGTTMSADANGAATLDEMIAQYKKLGNNQEVYNRLYTDQGDPRTFTWSTFNIWNLDPSNLSPGKLIVDASEDLSDGTIAESLSQRLAGTNIAIPDTATYVDDYQELFMGMGGIVPYVIGKAGSGGLGTLLDDAAKNSLLRGVLASYLSYADERLETHDAATATATVLRDVAVFLFGAELSTDASSIERVVFLRALTQGLVDNESSILVSSIASTLYNNILASSLVWEVCKPYLPEEEQTDYPEDEAHFKKAVVAFLSACANNDETALDALQTVLLGVGLFGNIPFASTIMALGDVTKTNLKDVAQVLVDDLLTNSSSQSSQSSSADEETLYKAVMDALRAYIQAAIDQKGTDTMQPLVVALKTATTSYLGTVAPSDADATLQLHRQVVIAIDEYLENNGVTPGSDTGKYGSLAAAADALLAKGIESIQAKAEGEDVKKSFGLIKDHPTQLRTVLMNMLFTGDGTKAYSTEYNLSVIATLMKNYRILIGAHTGEGYLSWARAVNLNGGMGGDHRKVTPTPTPAPTSATSMYRLYNPNGGEHFYTASAGERDLLVTAGWKDEGIGWYAPSSSTIPVYRLYNPNGGDHHYTLSAGERDLLIAQGWRDEGICWYSDANQRVSVYRQYNPNAKTGAHNFTKSTGERDLLVEAGWNDEGIAWYAVA